MKAIPGRSVESADGHGVRVALADGGRFEVQVLEQHLVRVRMRPAAGYKEPRTWAVAPVTGEDVAWEGRSRDDLAGFSCPEAQCVRQGDTAVQLRTGELSLTLQLDPLALQWQDAQGHPLASDRSTFAYADNTRTGAVRHYLARERAERYYGLGDKTGPLDLHGRRLRTFAQDALGYDPKTGDPLYKHWPFLITRTAGGQWYGQYYDTLAPCTFDLGQEHDNYHGFYRYIEIEDGDLDCYFIAGASLAEVVARFTQLIGGTALPPRWTLGFAQTAMGLTDAPDGQRQLDNFLTTIQKEGIPCSAFHYGSGYSSRGPRRYVFTWNSSKFPDPKTLNARFHAAGLHLVANTKPALLDDHPNYAQVAAQGGLIHDEAKKQPVLEQFWDGYGAHIDFTSRAGIAWWQQGLRAQVLDYGIDIGWNDNNEYAVLDDDAACDGFGTPLLLRRARPLHGMLMTRATFEAQAAHALERGTPNFENFTVTRAGGPGIQRYAQTWSGDNTTSWDTLRWNIRTGLQMSLSGMFNTGHDVGGFFGPVPEPELFGRWVQACALNPRMVMNSWKADGTVNVPWLHPEVTPHVAAAIRLRYALLPYMWSLFERAHAQHQAIIRPTFYSFPDDPQCFADSDDFMLGDDLLVAPVVEQGAVTRTVYLPAGPEAWFDFHTGARFDAGRSHTVAAPLSTLPLFVRAGARIPLAAAPAGGLPRFDDPVGETRSFG